MNRIIHESNFRGLRLGIFGVLALSLVMIIAGERAWGAPGTGPMRSPVVAAGGQITAPAQTAANAPTAVQQFEDVPPSNPFYDFVNNIYLDNIVSGYTCGGVGEPCVAPGNRPYYRPNNNVTRAQMGKFVDLGRRNIADAVGDRLVITNSAQIGLVISSTTTDSLDVNNASGAEAIQTLCLTPGMNCWALYSNAPSGDYAGVFSGGRGVSASSSDTGYAAVNANAVGTGANSYAVNGTAAYRAGYFKSTNTGLYSLYVDAQGGPTQGTSALEVNGSTRMEGNLYVAGSKAGYVVDIMQNASEDTLEVGDVVTIVGNSPAVLGTIPVVTVKKAGSAYDTGVVGIVDQVMYVPDTATKAAYDAQQAAANAAAAQQAALLANVDLSQGKPDPGRIAMPQTAISDADGTLHAIPDARQVAAKGGYASVVTLGAYKGIKVDAGFGAIHAGDMLVSSPHAGYAMKADDSKIKFGSVIGKALGDLDSGTGLIPVMVTLK
ncbi:MAG TPA: S-layer homology domain-containing protein [Chloroflexia bacterium]|nr:S-layer homology domain-containing protein [Chloroflexia bacterium]